MAETNDSTKRQELRGWRRVVFPIVAVLVGILLAGGSLEIALALGGYDRTYFNPLNSFHIGHPLVGYLGKPDFVGRFRRTDFDTVIAHDARGFRRQEHQKPQCRHRVLTFGDSFTWGWGVSQGEVFTDQMNLMMPTDCVENFGLSGSGTVQELALFQEFGEKELSAGDTVLL